MGKSLAAFAQLIVFGAAGWFLFRTAQDHWATIEQGSIAISWGPLLLASTITVGTYAYLIAAWVRSLRWWGERLAYRPALYIWFVTNLARFIPGAVWQFVGLAALVSAHGVSPVAATGAILIQQLLFLGTGAVLTLVMVPQLLGQWAAGLSPWAAVAGGALLIGLLVAGFPVVLPAVGRWVGRLVGRGLGGPAPARRDLAAYVTLLLAAWVCYGVAFWLFGQAVLGDRGPNLGLAVGAFTGSYVVGLLAVFAPGGIVVREAALVAALAPSLGPGPALLLAVGSRLWLLALELLTA